MLEALPIKVLRDEDSPIFGKLNVDLARLAQADLPVARGIVITPPDLHLKTILEHFDWGSKEIFEQSLTLVKKEVEEIEVPEVLFKEVDKYKKFLVDGNVIDSVKKLWIILLGLCIDQVKQRLWRDGFYQGITEGLEPQVVIFVDKLEAFGSAWFDPNLEDVVVNTQKGVIHPAALKKITELVELANRRLFIPHQYEWILDEGIRLIKVLPFTPPVILESETTPESDGSDSGQALPAGRQARMTETSRSSVKVFLDLSSGFSIEKEVDGIYIASEEIFDLNRPQSSWEELIFKLVESAQTFPDSPVLMKLADMSEGMGKIRGALRLLHQKSLLDPLIEAIIFCRDKKDLKNIHLVIPFARSVAELMDVKRNLAAKNLTRRNSLQIWLEIAVPENIVNLEEYLVTGLDGVVLNLDELMAHLNGFDHTQADLAFYKSEVSGLLKFLEDKPKLLHKSRVPFIAFGGLTLNPQILEFLIEKGVYGIVAEKYEAHSIKNLLHQAEKRMILRRAS